ncbi:hypothetical protein [Brachyspira pilosicoli]|uniref:Lipoprotein n=1 Tax=Brachyspira pilosicoli TaxID=52584 RepID=A0A5C8EWQ1_BRAPL|nr:hypothetical protein [Brachyspira pilosicoli]TXJ41431.1 hypothetical protein EPJ72_06930 [Brachyspira pilosicoli]
MQKQIKILLTLLTVLILAISCANNNPNDPNNNNNNNNNNQTVKPAWKQNVNYSLLIKDWYNERQPELKEVYQIRENGNDKVDFIVPDPSGNVSYSIVVTEIVWNSDNKSGIMYGTYSVAPSWTSDALNKWYAILFSDLTENTLYISQAYVTPSADAPKGNYTETLEKAKEVFTEANDAFTLGTYLVPQTK